MRAWLLVAALAAGCGGKTSSTPTQDAILAGNWNLATHASASCSATLPLDSRNRSYGNVVATQASGQVTFSIPVAPSSLSLLVSGVVFGNNVTGSAGLVDGINPGSVLSVQGSFNATLSGNTLTGDVNGFFTNLNAGGNCVAANHQFVFTRR